MGIDRSVLPFKIGIENISELQHLLLSFLTASVNWFMLSGC